MSKPKKTQQLGMNPSTASGRLVKDLLFDFAVKAGHTCHRCGEDLVRETFSIEHIKDWLDSEDPKGLYFDIENIAYSHLSCNVSAAKKPLKKYFTEDTKKEAVRLRDAPYHKTKEAKEKRRVRRKLRFKSTGKW